jgi:hypothetical protein
VPPILDVVGGWVHYFRDYWLGLGRLESKLLADQLRATQLTSPIFVCGLARSGSTLLHEAIAAHPGVATHRVKDYPLVYTPYWWRRATAKTAPAAPRERPHRDRVFITIDSPDALEEMLWLAFFPRCHDPRSDNRLGANESYPAFERFYRSHIRKLLLAEGATRYVAKANYHVARLPYLLRLLPDAKIVLPVRSPARHIASLMRQHRWFAEGHRLNPRALRYMQRSGHFEFGGDRRPINLGDHERVRQIEHDWSTGHEARGWARYWEMVYAYLARLLETDRVVRRAAKVIRFEALCDRPADCLREVLGHCGLPDGEPVVGRFAPTIRRPDYYDASFTAAEAAAIRQETATTAGLWGYAQSPGT